MGLVLGAIAAVGTPCAAATIELETGERIIAAIVERTETALIVDHPMFGRLEVPIATIALVDGAVLPLAATETAETADAPAHTTGLSAIGTDAAAAQDPPDPTPPPGPRIADPVNAPVPEKPPEFPWKSRIEFGLIINEGSTQDARVYTSLRSERQTTKHLVRIDGTYRYAENRGERSENRLTTGVYGEWGRHLPRWNVFGQTRWDTDEFQAWDWRLTGSGGVGYRIAEVKEARDDGTEFDKFLLTGRLGGGYRLEHGTVNDEVVPEGLAGATFTYRLNDSQVINGESTFFPDLRESGEFRAVSKLDWTMALPEMEGVNLKFGLLHEYESELDSGDQRNDFTAYATLVFDF